jgi:hypothetical protein
LFLAGLVAVVVGLHFYDRVEDRVWGDGVVVIEMVRLNNTTIWKTLILKLVRNCLKNHASVE